jgi:hypothetical protein
MANVLTMATAIAAGKPIAGPVVQTLPAVEKSAHDPARKAKTATLSRSRAVIAINQRH